MLFPMIFINFKEIYATNTADNNQTIDYNYSSALETCLSNKEIDDEMWDNIYLCSDSISCSDEEDPFIKTPNLYNKIKRVAKYNVRVWSGIKEVKQGIQETGEFEGIIICKISIKDKDFFKNSSLNNPINISRKTLEKLSQIYEFSKLYNVKLFISLEDLLDGKLFEKNLNELDNLFQNSNLLKPNISIPIIEEKINDKIVRKLLFIKNIPVRVKKARVANKLALPIMSLKGIYLISLEISCDFELEISSIIKEKLFFVSPKSSAFNIAFQKEITIYKQKDIKKGIISFDLDPLDFDLMLSDYDSLSDF